jgi:hypothetical protein
MRPDFVLVHRLVYNDEAVRHTPAWRVALRQEISRKAAKVSEREVTYDSVDAIFKNRFTEIN